MDQQNQEQLKIIQAQKLKTVSFWQHFSSLIEVLKGNNRTIEKVTFNDTVLRKIFEHNGSCLDQMICSLSEGNQHNLLVIFNVKKVFESFVSTIKQFKSLIEGVDRWIQAKRFSSQMQRQKAQKNKQINFQNNCCYYCQHILQEIRVNVLSSQLNISKKNRMDIFQKMFKDDLFQQDQTKFVINQNVRGKYPQAESYITQALHQQDRKLNQIHKYLREHKISVDNTKNEFDTHIIHDLVDQLLSKIKQKLSRSHKVKYDDILKEFKDRLNAYSLQIQQSYLAKSKIDNIDQLSNMLDKQQPKIRIKVKKNTNHQIKTFVLQQSQVQEIILKKQLQIGQKCTQIQFLKLQKQKYKSICSRLQKQLSASLQRQIQYKNISKNNMNSGLDNCKSGSDVQTQINQTQIIVIFNFGQDSGEAIQKISKISKIKTKTLIINTSISINNANMGNANVYSNSKQRAYMNGNTYQIQNQQSQLKQPIKQDAGTQYQFDPHENQQRECHELLLNNQKYKNRRKSVPKIIFRQNQRKSRDFTNMQNIQKLLQEQKQQQLSEQTSQKYLSTQKQLETLQTDQTNTNTNNMNKLEGLTSYSNNQKSAFKNKEKTTLSKQHMKTTNFTNSKITHKLAQKYNIQNNLTFTQLSSIQQRKQQNLFLTKPKLTTAKKVQPKSKIYQTHDQEDQSLKVQQQMLKSDNQSPNTQNYIQKKLDSKLLQQTVQNISEVKKQFLITKSFQKSPQIVESTQYKQIQQYCKLKQLKNIIKVPNEKKQIKKHKRYNTENSEGYTSFASLNKKKNIFKKQILFNISDLQIFGGISQSFVHQASSYQKEQMSILLADSQIKQVHRLYHYILALKQFRNAYYWNIFSFIIRPYQTVERNQIVVEQQNQKQLKKKLQSLIILHKKQCKTINCYHLDHFFNKIGFKMKI